MKIKKLFLVSITALSLLVGCNSNNNSSDSINANSPTPSITPSVNTGIDVELPKTLPIYDESSVQIHYQRNDNTYKPWSLWLWKDAANGSRFEFNYQDDNGLIAYYKLSDFNIDLENEPTMKLGFIVAKNPGSSWDAKDTPDDRFIEFANLTPDKNGVYHIYIFQSDSNIYLTPDRVMVDKIKMLTFENEKTIKCETTTPMKGYEVFENGISIGKNIVSGINNFTYTFTDEHPFSYENTYSVKVTYLKSNDVHEQTVSLQKLFSTENFENHFHYDGELGALYTNESTTFKVWSPISSKITLNIYDTGFTSSTSNSAEMSSQYDMIKQEKGVFEVNVPGDLQGKYYTYTVFNSTYPNGREIVDPYAKSAGVNGARGMIVDFSKTNPAGWDEISPIAYDRKELTVWETHVSDVTSSKTWTGTESNRYKFLGLQEEGTTYTQDNVTVKTGFDHIKELGVNAVQLLPIFDQANDEVNVKFNWGYNPLNYNVLEGAYSSNPYDGYARIKEFKQVVQKFNEAGINIIMDVVYNHTNSINGTNFDVLMPGYYYRYTYDGKPSNGSGCGNETASENSMMRKFMIDSASFWAKEYKLGGFRFDLMGLHDIETMNLLTEKVKTINPNITIYGEPWCGGTSTLLSNYQAIQTNGVRFKGYGQFNDQMRDQLVKGGLSAATEKSWISNTISNTSNMSSLTEGIRGYTSNGSSLFLEPDKTVNYVTCHDNYTLFDRFKAAGINDDAEVKKMAMLANSVVFTSQGTTFMLAGEEFLRTKQGNNNSYDASYEVNELDYSLKIKNIDMFNNYQKLISLKQNVDGLQLADTSRVIVDVKDSNNTIVYTIKDTTNSKEYIIIHTNGVNPSIRESIDLTGYTLYLDTLNVLEDNLSVVTPNAFQTIIAYKNI